MSKRKTSPSKTAPAPPPSSANWLPHAIALLSVLIYATGFSNPLVGMDDHTATVDNEAVKTFNIFGYFNLGMYAPLTWFFYAVAYRLHGGADSGDTGLWYHIFSALVHAVNVILVYRLFFKISDRQFAAAVVALFFAVHPIQVESVSWAAGFSTPLYALFTLASLLYYLDYTTDGNRRSYYLALLMAFLGALAKSAAIVVPLLLIALDLWRRPKIEWRRLIAGYTPFFAMSLVFGLLTIYSRQDNIMLVGSIFERFLLICFTPLFYIGKILLPINFNIYYSFDNLTGGESSILFYLSPLVLLLFAVAAWRLRNKFPYLGWGMLFFLTNHLFSLPFVPIGTFELISDHYNYIASTGIFFMIGTALADWQQRQPAMTATVKGIVGVIAVILIILSIRQIGVWKDTMTLMNNAITNGYYSNGRIYYWRGIEYGKRGQPGDIELAIADLTKALEMDSTLYDCYKYRGTFFGMRREFESSISDLTRYLQHNPKDVEYRFNRGVSYMKINRYEEAISDFNEVLTSQPDLWQVYGARANAWSALGDTARATADRAEMERRKASPQR